MAHTTIGIGDSVSHDPGEKLVVKTKGKFVGEYSIMIHYGMLKAVPLVYEAMPTLTILLNSVERENLVRMRSIAVAKQLNVSVATVERHMKKLRELQLIIPDEAEGDKKSAIFNWRLCPFLVWSGHTDTLVRYIETLPKEHPWWDYADPKVFKRVNETSAIKL